MRAPAARFRTITRISARAGPRSPVPDLDPKKLPIRLAVPPRRTEPAYLATTPGDIEKRVNAFAQRVHWNADDAIWRGNIIPSAGHSVSQKAVLVTEAIKAVKAEIAA